ncbi:hypothetical protein ACOMHN_026856 [Nucella lapillus]
MTQICGVHPGSVLKRKELAQQRGGRSSEDMWPCVLREGGGVGFQTLEVKLGAEFLHDKVAHCTTVSRHATLNYGQSAGSKGELRCYCNEAGCVSTGYMCKSPAGTCYTALQLQGDSTRTTHGCLDSVPSHHRSLCAGRSSEKLQPGQHSGEKDGEGLGRTFNGGGGTPREGRGGLGGEGGVPLMICCAEDMCNYIDNIDVQSLVTLARGKNGSLFREDMKERTACIIPVYPKRRFCLRYQWLHTREHENGPGDWRGNDMCVSKGATPGGQGTGEAMTCVSAKELPLEARGLERQ